MIDIRLTFLNNNINKLKEIVDSGNTQSDITCLITSSKGTYASELNNVANELTSIQNSLDVLLTNTISVLENAKDSYIESDKSSADLFEIVNTITK